VLSRKNKRFKAGQCGESSKVDSTDAGEYTALSGTTAAGAKSAARSSRKVNTETKTGKCTLSSDVEIEGSITFQKELVIDGKVQGQVTSNGVLTIGENAKIRGAIQTKSVTVHGKVHGNITAERCELKSNCTLEGDLKAARLIIEDGATFIGSSQISPPHRTHS
jgi:cytoskeletal protein CcmA (bactofilin family)